MTKTGAARPCEKPLTADPTTTDEVLAAAQRTGSHPWEASVFLRPDGEEPPRHLAVDSAAATARPLAARQEAARR